MYLLYSNLYFVSIKTVIKKNNYIRKIVTTSK